MSKSTLRNLLLSCLPTPVRVQGRSYLPNLLFDIRDRVTGKSDTEIPPRRLNISGNGSFRELGQHNVLLCQTLGRLKPSDHVLDLGCGIGRTALAMASFLSAEGSYEGLDVIQFAIKWCRSNIAARHSNFHFTHADVFNKTYNPGGSSPASQYVFPFASETFSFIVANSLFTHLLPETANHYINEAYRVLKPGGRCLSTWFLLDGITEPFVSAGKSIFPFKHRFEHHAQCTLDLPEQAVAFSRQYVEETFLKAGFTLETVQHGGWSGAPAELDSGQDVIVARK